MKARSMGLGMMLVLVVSLGGWAGQGWGNCVDDYKPYAHITCFDHVDDLMDHLLADRRRGHALRMVQPRAGLDTPLARHNQYFGACFFFSVSPILEYLGFAQFGHRGHYRTPMSYRTRTRIEELDLDVGYRGSAEDLIALYVTHETIERTIVGSEGAEIYPCGFFKLESAIDPPDAKACSPTSHLPGQRQQLNDDRVACFVGPGFSYNIFNPGQEYGFCQQLTGKPIEPDRPSAGPIPADTFLGFLHETSGGCGDSCVCRGDATCGAYYFLNQVLPYQESLAGASDARDINPKNEAEALAVRKILKGFVDHNIPLLVAVQEGNHYMTVVGYADLGEEGLPLTAIAADPVQLVYWTVRLGWSHWHKAHRWSPHGITPWNQHLGRGCETGGWASELDRDPQISAHFKLCTMPETVRLQVAEPHYGVRLTCERDDRAPIVLHAPVEDLFIADERLLACDRVTLRYVDGHAAIRAAQINLFEYDAARAAWTQVRRITHDWVTVEPAPAGRSGEVSNVVWDENWGGRHWLTASGVRQPDDRHRTTVVLTLGDGRVRRVEIAPLSTYGVELQCLVGSTMRTRYRANAREAFFAVNRQTYSEALVLADDRNRRCDKVVLRLALGADDPVFTAELKSYSYTEAHGWQAAAPAWHARREVVPVNLSGQTLLLTWDTTLPDDYWLVAKDLASGETRTDRKTVLRLKDEQGQIVRQIEVVPY